ncbi:hypothetical protein EPYR_00025 [Erwinia pyrifoliae DSM 12163]|nr:hypothetical protein EPYR_00025 [Erwinia pyrifoliae DSM 12163]
MTGAFFIACRLDFCVPAAPGHLSYCMINACVFYAFAARG